MMVGESFRRAWRVFKNDMGSWLVFGLVWTLLASVVGTIVPIVGGMLVLPMVVRETSNAVSEGRSPAIEGLFEFENLGGDLASTLLYSISQFVGLLFCCVGWPVAWILYWYTIELAADARVSPTDAMKLSMTWSKKNLGDTVGMAFVGCIFNLLGASVGMGIGVFFTAPITVLAWVMYWQMVKSDVYAMGRAQGLHVRDGAPAALGVGQPDDGMPGAVSSHESADTR